MTELEEHNLVVCAWRLDTTIDADKYVDSLDKLIYLAKKEVFDDIEENLDYYKTVFIKKKFGELKTKHLQPTKE